MRVPRFLPASAAAFVVFVVSAACAVPAGAVTGYGDVCGLLGSPVFCAVGSFGFPVGVAVDNSGSLAKEDVYVVDYAAGRVLRFNKSGDPASFVATGTNVLDGSSTPAGSFSIPAYIAVGRSGDVYVENIGEPVIDVFNAKGEYVPLAPGAFVAPSYEGGSYAPFGVGVDEANGDVYVSDRQAGGVIDVFEEDGAWVRTFPTGAGGSDSVAVDNAGDVYVDNEDASVTEFTATGVSLGTLDSTSPQAVAIDPSDQNVLVGENGSSSSYQIAEYKAPANPGETPTVVFGNSVFASDGSYGIGVNGTTGQVYAANATGENALIFEEGPKPETPLTNPATGITATTAVLNGQLNPGSATEKLTYHFAYDTDGSCTGAGITSPGETEGNHASVSSEATGLEPSQKYTFCVDATNTFGTSEGSAESFTTLGTKPSVDSESFSGVSSTDAILEAQVNPENQGTEYSFRLAANEALTGATIVPGGVLPSGFGDQPAAADIGGGLVPGETYYYRALAKNATGTSEGPVQSFTTIGPPVMSGEQAQDETRTTVILSGNVDPKGASTTYHYELISQAGYQAALEEGAPDPYAAGRRSENGGLGADFVVHPTGQTVVKELLPGTTYHYALVGTNQAGSTIGPDETFTTGPATPPVVQTGQANGVEQNTASIAATIDTEGLQTSYGFEIGTSTDYGPPTGLGSVGAGSTETAVTLNLTGLLPGTVYHYRITATNIDGTSYGTDMTFTTSSFPNVLATPPAPLPFLTVPTIAFPVEQAGVTGNVTVKTLTRAQRLANALQTCKKQAKSKRAKCEKRARAKYGPAKKKK